jgi:hypothetical protein
LVQNWAIGVACCVLRVACCVLRVALIVGYYLGSSCTFVSLAIVFVALCAAFLPFF